MGRRKKIDRPRAVEVQIPDSIWSKVQAELYSEIEGKIPFGAVSSLMEQLLTDWLRSRGALQVFVPTEKGKGDIVL